MTLLIKPKIHIDADYLAECVRAEITRLDRQSTTKNKGKVPCNSERGWVGMKPGCKRAKKGTAQRVRGVQRVRRGKSRKPAKATVKKAAKPKYNRKVAFSNGQIHLPYKVAPEMVPQVIRETEDYLRLQKDYESLVVYGADGQRKLFKDGGKAEVAVTDAEAATFKDGIITHNHSKAWGFDESDPQSGGNSFSTEDIHLVVETDAAEIRAVSRGFRFSMKRPPGGWKISGEDARDLMLESKNEVMAEGYNRIYAADDQAAQIKIETSIVQHLISESFAKKTGAIYTREDYEEMKFDSDTTGKATAKKASSGHIKTIDVDPITGKVRGKKLRILDRSLSQPVYTLPKVS